MSIASTVMIPTTNQIGPVNISLATDGIRLPRATSGPVLDLDLMTMAKQLRNEAAWSDGRNSRTLVKHRDLRMVLTVMRTGAHLHRHQARGTVLIHVLSGYIRARVVGEVVEAPVGHALSLDPNLEHEIEAVDESAVLITIAWRQDFDIVRKEPISASGMRPLASHCSIANHIESAARRKTDAR